MKYYLVLVAIFKNETAILQEWLEHYFMEGVDHIYLIDNGSEDQPQRILAPYVREGTVEYHVDPRPHMQTGHYNSYLDQVKRDAEWVIVVDLDEFIYSRLQFTTIADYLKSVESTVSQIYIPWKLFGSSGWLEQPANCLDHFIHRTLYNHVKTNGMRDADHMFIKTIVRTKYLTRMEIHCSGIQAPSVNVQQITSDGQPADLVDPSFQSISEEILKKSALHLNHYPIQSYEWFRRVKMPRGSAAMAVNDKVRTIGYYNSFDSHSNQIIDEELCRKHNQIKVYYGAGVYFDVTRKVLNHFRQVDPVTRVVRIVIDDQVKFNEFFGDPCPGKVKNLVVRQKSRLTIYPETKHGPITIIVQP